MRPYSMNSASNRPFGQRPATPGKQLDASLLGRHCDAFRNFSLEPPVLQAYPAGSTHSLLLSCLQPGGFANDQPLKSAFLNKRGALKAEAPASIGNLSSCLHKTSVPRVPYDMHMSNGLPDIYRNHKQQTQPMVPDSLRLSVPVSVGAGDNMDSPSDHGYTSLSAAPPSIPLYNYYSAATVDATQNLQTSGGLRAPSWILVPPAPEGGGDHLRTGRNHEIKSKVGSDRTRTVAYMDQDLRQMLQNRLKMSLVSLDEPLREKVPITLGAYTCVTPVESQGMPRSSVTFALPTQCFKAWSPRLNGPVFLRRVVLDTATPISSELFFLAKQLTDLENPNIVTLRDVFPSNAFDDNSVIFVHDYHACSSTLQQTHMSDPMKLTSFSSPFNVGRGMRPHSSSKNGPSDLVMLPEFTAWTYLIQLTQALRFIHQKTHRACCTLDPSKILIQDGTRIRINCFGLRDILNYADRSEKLMEDQLADFISLGKLMLGLTCGTVAAIQPSQQATSISLLSRAYNHELSNLINGLVAGQISTMDQLIRATAPFAYDHMTTVYDSNDFLERQVCQEMESGRLFRLISKLQSILERNDGSGTAHGSSEWSETGDRYMLKLFRDFVFHQTDPLGAPYLDLAHIVNVLNKVEAASLERLCLVSRDSQNVVIATYAEVRHWLDSSFASLVEQHRRSMCEQQLAHQRQQEHIVDPVQVSLGNTQSVSSVTISSSTSGQS